MLATIQDMGAWKAIPSAEDPVANLALKAADGWVKGILGRDVEFQPWATRMSGDDTPLLYPRNWPVQSVTALVVEKSEWRVLMPDESADADQEAFLDPSRTFIEARRGRTFPAGAGNLYLSYFGGYEKIPSDLALVTANAAHLIYLERDRLGDNQITFGQVQVNQFLRGVREYEFFLDTLRKYTLFGVRGPK